MSDLSYSFCLHCFFRSSIFCCVSVSVLFLAGVSSKKGAILGPWFLFCFFLHGCNLHSVKQFLFSLKSKTAVLYNSRLLQLSVFLCGMAYNLVCCFPCSEVGGSPGQGGECRAFQTVGRMLYH